MKHQILRHGRLQNIHVSYLESQPCVVFTLLTMTQQYCELPVRRLSFNCPIWVLWTYTTWHRQGLLFGRAMLSSTSPMIDWCRTWVSRPVSFVSLV